MPPRLQHCMMSVRSILTPLIDLVLPPRCPLCGEGISAQAGLCANCWSTLEMPGEPCCSACQRPLEMTAVGADVLCAPCMAASPAHDGVAAATIYNNASRQLVLALKHGRRIALAPMMARLMAARLADRKGDWTVVPVPLHRGRLWRRSFNQAALLARIIASETGFPMEVDALLRRRRTPVLRGLDARSRRKAVSGAIAANPARIHSLKGRNIILVDDVMTSGATSSACIVALKRAGAWRVAICCFARVLHEVGDEDQAAKRPGVTRASA